MPANLNGPYNSIFETPWWFDQVHGPGWKEVVVRQGEHVVARMPYIFSPGRIRTLTQPALTPWIGPWLAVSDGSRSSMYGRETKLLQQLIDALPAYDLLRINLHPNVGGWLPFRWAGFDGTVAYTYRRGENLTEAQLSEGLHKKVAWSIRKAEPLGDVGALEDVDAAINLFRATLNGAGKPLPLGASRLGDLIREAVAADKGSLQGVTDRSGGLASCAFFVDDVTCRYYVLGGADRNGAVPGAPSLLLWNAMKQASASGRAFDFEGSSLPTIEPFFRGFGGRRTPFFQIRDRRGRFGWLRRLLARLPP